MMLRRVKSLLACSALCLFAIGAQAQVEVLLGDEHMPQRSVPAVPRQSTTSSEALRVTALSLPFLDDFSTGAKPSDALWIIGPDGHEPLVSDAKGLHAPSKGVATFEGTTSGGVKYDGDDAGNGLADSLSSQAIDLSALTAADSVYLSFYLQPGGLGDKPEVTDSFVVYFDTTGNFDYAAVRTLKGTDLPTTRFSPVMLPLTSSLYFHGNFHFKFVAFGNLNGENDQWHLDYVRMASGRTLADSLANDVSVVGFIGSPLGEYTAYPLDQWDAASRMGAFGVEVSNRKGSSHSATVSVSITDATLNHVFSGTTLVSSPSLTVPAAGHDTAALTAFSDQTLSDVALIRATATVTGGGDISANDAMVRHYGVDSVMALDDGVADQGYGLTVARSFCQEFEAAEKDTLTGVMIRFTPAIYVSPIGQVTDLDNKSFRLVVWDHLHPDSVLTSVSSGMNIVYGDSLTHFQHYELLTRVPVEGKYWVGIEQVDGMPLGVGFDRNTDNSSKVYFADASGGFVNTSQKGTLMIRPVFSNYVFVGTDDPATAQQGASLRAWPNPVVDDRFAVQVEGNWPPLGTTVHLTDLVGRTLWTSSLPEGSRWELDRPALPHGAYLLTLRNAGRSLTTQLIW